MDIYTGKEIVNLFGNIQNDEFADDRIFKEVQYEQY